MVELRLVQPADVGEFLRVSESSGLFRPEELPAVEGMLSAHFAAGDSSEQTILVSESEGRLTGVVCFTERPFADRVWELQMIAVAGDLQGRGIGSQLLRAVECVVRDRGGRLLGGRHGRRGPRRRGRGGHPPRGELLPRRNCIEYVFEIG